jgi:multisubunit Na+/H+ antiporter MnhF subunit
MEWNRLECQGLAVRTLHLERLESLSARQRMIRQPFKARTSDEVMALQSAMATAVLAVIIVAMLYFGREIIIPIAMAILLSFVLAPLVGILQRIRIPRG